MSKKKKRAEKEIVKSVKINSVKIPRIKGIFEKKEISVGLLRVRL